MKNIALFLISLLFPAMVFAASVTPTPTLTVTPTPEPIKYDLPYPGMLPNNPLYVVKQARDWILDKLIVDPAKKTEFYILQGDKRLAMGMELSVGGNAALGEQTISKGEKYMNNAMQTLLALKSQGKDVPAYLTDHLTQSLAKHAEVISGEITKTTDATIKSGLVGSLDLVKTVQADLPKLQ